MNQLERWDHQDRDHVAMFRGEGFVAINPGQNGWAFAYYKGEGLPAAFCHALQPESINTLLKRVGARVIVVERQYVRDLKRGQSIVELVFQMGMALGWVAAVRPFSGTNLFEVAPATWQAHQRRLEGIQGQLPRGEGIALAIARASKGIGMQDEWQRANRATKEGLASAYGIGEWWRSL